MTEEQEKQYAKYENQDFSVKQLLEIKQGLEARHDVAIYARTGIPAEEMAYIRKYLNLNKATASQTKADEEPEEDYEKIEEQFVSCRQTIQLSVFEKIVAFAVTVAGIAIIAALYTMLMCWPR